MLIFVFGFNVPFRLFTHFEQNQSLGGVKTATSKQNLACLTCLFVCGEVSRPYQQLRPCRAGQLPIYTVPGQA